VPRSSMQEKGECVEVYAKGEEEEGIALGENDSESVINGRNAGIKV
jgi:hypothetical protein